VDKFLRALGLLVPHRRRLWGIPGLWASFAFGAVNIALVLAILLREPLLGGVALGFAAVAEASDILAPSRRMLPLSKLRGDLGTRMASRVPLFLIVLAAAKAPHELIATFAASSLLASLAIRVLRSDRLYLYTDRALRPVGAMTTGVDRLMKATNYARRRDLAELPLQAGVLLVGLVIVLPGSSFTTARAIVIAGGIVGLATAYAGFVAAVCRALRPALMLVHDEEVLAEFLAYDPEVLCYFNGHQGSMYAVDVWLRTFEVCDRRVALVYRHRGVRDVATSLPGIVIQSDAMVERLVAPSTKIALYPANGTLNVHLQRDHRLAHVFIGHGDSDKVGSASPYSRSYDQVWVAGPAGADRYAAAGVEIPPEQFVVVGRPPLSPQVRRAEHDTAALADPGGHRPVEQLVGELARLDGGTKRITVLYAPTWEGYFDASDYTSVDTMGLELVRTLLALDPKVRVIFKPHPMTGRRRLEVAEAAALIDSMLADDPDHHPSPDQHPGVDLYDWFDLADMLVTDVSSVLTDFLAWDRPCVVTNPRRMAIETLSRRFPSTRAAYVLDQGSAGAHAVLDSALKHDPLASRRAEVKEYFLGSTGEDPLDLFNAALNSLYDHRTLLTD
jgi:hypothetical protein